MLLHLLVHDLYTLFYLGWTKPGKFLFASRYRRCHESSTTSVSISSVRFDSRRGNHRKSGFCGPSIRLIFVKRQSRVSGAGLLLNRRASRMKNVPGVAGAARKCTRCMCNGCTCLSWCRRTKGRERTEPVASNRMLQLLRYILTPRRRAISFFLSARKEKCVEPGNVSFAR